MQMTLDRPERERCALRTDQQLEALGLTETQRAVIFLVLRHPRALRIDGVRRAVSLAISYREASRWLTRNSGRLWMMRLDASNLKRAVDWWTSRGVMHAARGKRTTLLVDSGRLAAWHDAEAERMQEALRSWVAVTVCDSPLPSVTVRDPSVNERMNEYKESINQSEAVTNQPINPSTDQPGPDLPPLPDAIFASGLIDRELLERLHAWWQSEGLRDRGHEPIPVIGAVLAARDAEASDPQRYIAACLARGVNQRYRNRAAELLKLAGPRTEQPYAAHGVAK